MFKVSEKDEIFRNILKCDYIRQSPSEMPTINTQNNQIHIKIPRGDSVNILLGNLLRLNFGVLHAATNNRYIDGDIIRIVNLVPIDLFSIYKLASISWKHIEDINHAHIVC